MDEVIKNSTLQLAEQKNPKAHSDSTSNSAALEVLYCGFERSREFTSLSESKKTT